MRPDILEAYNRFQETSKRFLQLATESDDGPPYRVEAQDVPDADRFDDMEKAIQRSQELGLDGNVHTIADGSYVPGATHADYLAVVDDGDGGGDGPDADDPDNGGDGQDGQDTDGQASTTDPDGGSDGGVDWDADDTVTAQATGTVSVSADQDAVAAAADAADGDGGLYGVIWGAGDHDLALGGEPAGVHVPAETIPQTFDLLDDDVAAGDVTIGVDHPDDDSVLAQTGLVDIGMANDVALTADDQNIVLTDSELTNGDAQAALEAGEFDGYDFSVVADVAVETDDNGERVTTDDGRFVIAGTRIKRADIVTDGAVDAASIVRDKADLPDLADATATVQDVAADLPNQNTAAAVDALEASSEALNTFISSSDMDNPADTDVDDLEDAQEQLSAAASVIDDLTDQKDQLQAQATAFEAVAEAQDVDLDDFDDDVDAAQAVIDKTTQDLRREIAQLEAGLPDYDTTEDDVDDRVDELAGSSADDLRSKRGDLAYESLQAQNREDKFGSAVADGDGIGANAGLGGGSGASEEADDIAEGAMDGADIIKAESAGKSPAEYVRAEYDVDPSQHDSSADLHAEIMAENGGGD